MLFRQILGLEEDIAGLKIIHVAGTKGKVLYYSNDIINCTRSLLTSNYSLWPIRIFVLIKGISGLDIWSWNNPILYLEILRGCPSN